MGIFGTGIKTDINYLSNICFEMMIRHIKAYDTYPSLHRLSSQLSEVIYMNTNEINKRPYGVSLCLFSYDDSNDNCIKQERVVNAFTEIDTNVDTSNGAKDSSDKIRVGINGDSRTSSNSRGSMYVIDPSGNMERRQLCFQGKTIELMPLVVVVFDCELLRFLLFRFISVIH